MQARLQSGLPAQGLPGKQNLQVMCLTTGLQTWRRAMWPSGTKARKLGSTNAFRKSRLTVFLKFAGVASLAGFAPVGQLNVVATSSLKCCLHIGCGRFKRFPAKTLSSSYCLHVTVQCMQAYAPWSLMVLQGVLQS